MKTSNPQAMKTGARTADHVRRASPPEVRRVGPVEQQLRRVIRSCRRLDPYEVRAAWLQLPCVIPAQVYVRFLGERLDIVADPPPAAAARMAWAGTFVYGVELEEFAGSLDIAARELLEASK